MENRVPSLAKLLNLINFIDAFVMGKSSKCADALCSTPGHRYKQMLLQQVLLFDPTVSHKDHKSNPTVLLLPPIVYL